MFVGVLSRELWPHVKSIVGVDISQRMVSRVVWSSMSYTTHDQYRLTDSTFVPNGKVFRLMKCARCAQISTLRATPSMVRSLMLLWYVFKTNIQGVSAFTYCAVFSSISPFR